MPWEVAPEAVEVTLKLIRPRSRMTALLPRLLNIPALPPAEMLMPVMLCPSPSKVALKKVGVQEEVAAKVRSAASSYPVQAPPGQPIRDDVAVSRSGKAAR